MNFLQHCRCHFLFPHRIQQAWPRKNIPIERTKYRDHDCSRGEQYARLAKPCFHRFGCNCGTARQMPNHFHGQHQVIRNVHTNIKKSDQTHATKQCKRDISLGIFDFFCNRCDVPPTMIGPQDCKESTKEMAEPKLTIPRPPRLQILEIRLGLCSTQSEKVKGNKGDHRQGNDLDDG